MSNTILIACVVSVGAALAGCQTSPTAQAPGNRMLLQAGFVAKRPVTTASSAAFRNLPANQMVQQTVAGKVTYLYADPTGCNCIYVGSAAALKSYVAMQNTMAAMTQQLPGSVQAVAPGLSLNNIDDLGSWTPL